MTFTELKLFAREPLTVVFTLALPLLILFVMGGIFGNTPDPEGLVYRGVGPMDYYAPAYIGLVIASIGVIGLPVQLAAYRERGVLRRFRASSVSVWTVLGSQALVGFAIAIVGSLLVGIASCLAHHIHAPQALLQVVAAFVLSTMTFASVGVLLGALLPTARAAQGAGALLWFVMMILGGAGPPPEVLTGAMGVVAKLTPAHHAVLLLQGPWLGFGWDSQAMLVLLGFLAVSALFTLRFFRWE